MKLIQGRADLLSSSSIMQMSSGVLQDNMGRRLPVQILHRSVAMSEYSNYLLFQYDHPKTGKLQGFQNRATRHLILDCISLQRQCQQQMSKQSKIGFAGLVAGINFHYEMS